MNKRDIDVLVCQLLRRGVSLAVDGNRLFVEAPSSVLVPSVLDSIRQRKLELIEYLRPRSCADCGVNCGSGVRCSPCAAARVSGAPCCKICLAPLLQDRCVNCDAESAVKQALVSRDGAA